RTCYQAGDVDDLDDRGDHLLGLDVLLDSPQAVVGDRHDADVRVDGAKRIVSGLGLAGGERVEHGALANVRETNDPDGQCHRPHAYPGTLCCGKAAQTGGKSWRLPASSARLAWQGLSRMRRALGRLIIAAALAGSGITGSGWGDQFTPHGITSDQLLAHLRALPGVTADVGPTEQTDFQYYVLHFRQPVDHNDPSQRTFLQEVSLLHRSDLATVPMIVQTSGYADYYLDR